LRAGRDNACGCKIPTKRYSNVNVVLTNREMKVLNHGRLSEVRDHLSSAFFIDDGSHLSGGSSIGDANAELIFHPCKRAAAAHGPRNSH
jgi:hypothetical protein